MHTRLALSIVGAFRFCRPAIPILSICRGWFALEWRGLQRRRATIGAGWNRLALLFAELRAVRRVAGCRRSGVCLPGPSLGGGMHTRILERQKLDGLVTSQAREVQRFLIHPPAKVVGFGIVSEPSDDLG